MNKLLHFTHNTEQPENYDKSVGNHFFCLCCLPEPLLQAPELNKASRWLIAYWEESLCKVWQWEDTIVALLALF